MFTSTRSSLSVRLGRGLLAVLLLAGLCLAAGPGRALASGAVFDGTPGTSAPPTTLGPYTMLPFEADPRPEGSTVTTVPGPTGDIAFDRDAEHRIVGSSWGTWSHGYTGDVYMIEGQALAGSQQQAAISEPSGFDRVTIALPPNTMGFYLYVEPNNFGEYAVVVEANGVGSGLVGVVGDSGAKYFGFYSTGSALESIQVAVDTEANGFAIGEFGIFEGTPTEGPAFVDARADVSVVVFGGWGGMPVQAWVGGTAQPTLYTAPNDEGDAAVLFSFWPPEATAWTVSVAPGLPAGLDPALWELKLVGIRRGDTWGAAPTSGSVTIVRGSQVVLYYQLWSKAGG